MRLLPLAQRAALATHRRVGGLFPRGLRRRVRRWLFPEGNATGPVDQRKRMEVIIDVVGSCNLRCPSCPVGNLGPVNPTGLIDIVLFSRLMEKAGREYQVTNVSLFNWAEPLLHPALPELIRIVKRNGLRCSLSSNLNILKNEDALLLAKPDELRISLSGFTQEIYGQTHAAGNIERVKSNMKKLSEARQRTGNRETHIYVYYHKYKHNLHEAALMRSYAEGLGFGWMEHWAYYMPFENVANLIEGQLEDDKRTFVETRFALPIVDALEAARLFRDEPCRLYDEQIVLDLKGNLILCCTVYDFEKNQLGSFLDMTPADLERAKSKHPTCSRCAGHGIHKYMTYVEHPELRTIYDYLAKRDLSRSNQPSPELLQLGVRSVA